MEYNAIGSGFNAEMHRMSEIEPRTFLRLQENENP